MHLTTAFRRANARRVWLAVFFSLNLGIAPGYLEAAPIAQRIVSANGDPILYPSYLTEYNSKLYFRANNIRNGNNVELWEFDGTAARLVAEINPGPNGSDPSYLAGYNGKLYFCATASTGASKLWCYDSTNGAALAPGSGSNASLPEELIAYEGNLFFRAARFGSPSNIGIELWKFDGMNQIPLDMFAGTGSSYPQHFISYNGALYFSACGTAGQGSELWRYNNTGTLTEAARIYPNNGSSPESFCVFNGQLYFSAYDGVHGRELWRYDGIGAFLAADIVPGDHSSNPSGLTVYSNKLYFCATDEVHGYELWVYDGTSAQMLAEINPTPNPGNGDDFLMDSSPANLTVFNDVLYFSADDGAHGRELWSYDGTKAQMVLDINPGQYGSGVSELTVYNGTLYFSADDGWIPSLNSLVPQVFALSVPPPLSLEEALDAPGVVWTTGSHPWLPETEVTHDGVDAAVSGQVHNADDYSWLKATNIMGPGCVTFRWKAQMTCGAFARVSTYGTNGFSQTRALYPTADWQWETLFLGEGPQEILWVANGNCDDPNQISVWVDEVVISGPGNESAPVFTTEPANAIVSAGVEVGFRAVASGFPVPTLQWRFKGVDIPNATNTTLALTNVQAGDEGLYSVVASNALGTVTSGGYLTVTPSSPVILAQPASQTVTYGLPARFEVGARGTLPMTYQWRFNGLPIAGETNAWLSLNPVTVNQAGAYSVVISNPVWPATSLEASLSVVQVAAWGEETWGKTQVPSNACDVVAVSAGSGHSLGLKRNGTVLAWGDAQSVVPPDLSAVAKIAAGGWHSLALRSNGTVVAWGYNGDHQTNVPSTLNDVVQVAGGLRHSLALKANGTVLAWGYEASAQPTVAASLREVAAIAAGTMHSLALLSNGTVVAWGDNSSKQCDVPAGLVNVKAVAAGSGHSIALKNDGTVVAWGTNDFNQSTIPVEATNVVAIAAGDQHNLALRSDGVLLAWGDNRYGQTTIPSGLSGVAAFAAGRAHSVALLGAIPQVTDLHLQPTYFPTGEFSLSVPTVRGRTYLLEANDSMSGSGWVGVAVLFGDGSTKSFSESAISGQQRFYRIRMLE